MEEQGKILYTVILTNYNSGKYIFQALDSIFCQDYPSIELIITDDASIDFDLDTIKKYVEKNKKKNIKSIKFVVNKRNSGTVKILNKALKKASVEYILFFASDDVLVNDSVLTNFSEAFKDSYTNIVSSQWIICDDDLKPFSEYLNFMEGFMLNFVSARLQFLRLCKANIYGAGATSYRAAIFRKYGFLDEKYRLLEDWPFWLRLLWKGEKIYYKNFKSLYHRSGGISEDKKLTNTKIIFLKELILTYHYEILSKIDSFSVFTKVYLLKCFNYQLDHLNQFLDLRKEYKKLNYFIDSKRLWIWWRLDRLNPHLIYKIVVLWTYNKQVVFSFMATIIYGIINALRFSHLNYNLFLFSCLLFYLIVFILFDWFIKLKKIIKERRSRV